MQYFILTEVSDCDLLIVVESFFLFPFVFVFVLFLCVCVCMSVCMCVHIWQFHVCRPINLILIAFITGNSSLEPLIEGLCAQIHVNLR